MKPRLVTSLVIINLAWTASLLYRTRSPSSVQAAKSIPEMPPLVSEALSSPSSPPFTTAGPGAPQFRWAQVESTDYNTYIKNLRAIGCPEQTIRDIVTADVHALFQEKHRQLQARALDPAQTSAELVKINADVYATLAALNMAPARDSAVQPMTLSAAPLKRSALADIKQPLLHAWQEQFSSQRETLVRSFAGREPSESEAGDLWHLDADFDRRLDEIVGPEEREDFEIQNFPAALALRESLLDLEVSDDEFRALYQARKQFDAAAAKDSLAENALTLAELEEATRQILGPDRFAIFEKGQGHDDQAPAQNSEGEANPDFAAAAQNRLRENATLRAQ